MSFSPDEVLPAMIAAAKVPLLNGWAAARPVVTQQLSAIALQTEHISNQLALGKITQAEAAELFAMEQDAATSILAEVEGVGKITAESAINAAIDAVGGMINGAVGFALV
ncbi:hypothetical protein [Terriglobus roseus]|uniref:Uncharacterized protein n=1 Tax=Terriglobus roseus TaxID=392734 RepID=A0A1H4LK71_9BACT|nr:hypothetical protein [Terriglobus roseus]SEB70978.1 hypothetical protein SAMN05443244_1625 [Terriglobus roseus]